MTRIYHPHALPDSGSVILSPEASHHLCTVLRTPTHESFTLFCGDGYDYEATLTRPHKKQAEALISKKTLNQNESPLHFHLVQGLCRSEKMDWILQKSVELGVKEITLIVTERSQGGKSLKDPDWLEKKHAHYKQVILSACEQSGRAQLPTLNPMISFESFLSNSPEDPAFLGVILDPYSSKTMKDLNSGEAASIQFLIGPEGGFSLEEIQKAMAKHFLSVRLGPRVLRTETAALAFLSAVQILWGDF